LFASVGSTAMLSTPVQFAFARVTQSSSGTQRAATGFQR